MKKIILLLSLSYSSIFAADLTKYCENSAVNKCVTPYGEKLGASNGVSAYSNCRSECVKPIPNSFKKENEKDVYTGIKWQCVEYARRWWITQKNITFGSVDTANEIFDLTSAEDLKTGKKIKLIKTSNGETTIPKEGDLLIYKKSGKDENLPYGHVAVIVNVNISEGYVDIAEANYNNSVWEEKEKYSRRLALVAKDNKFVIYDVNYKNYKKEDFSDKSNIILGWVRADF
ncbi:CHAP domain-containing protein [Pigmentibacter sp. JX0631]|uniref:CHAP domain-containing protein n=1 Tax=Pigmentibacter sp. JX0631 TaxID=2976982 RepID=UPI0024692082|nr:CHAP domain-containing protein [Pigmentibacter sp. JX0631]WGL61290.1 CHAP domain-containing protein [Pigmentibacter sp. JX0631]